MAKIELEDKIVTLETLRRGADYLKIEYPESSSGASLTLKIDRELAKDPSYGAYGCSHCGRDITDLIPLCPYCSMEFEPVTGKEEAEEVEVAEVQAVEEEVYDSIEEEIEEVAWDEEIEEVDWEGEDWGEPVVPIEKKRSQRKSKRK